MARSTVSPVSHPALLALTNHRGAVVNSLMTFTRITRMRNLWLVTIRDNRTYCPIGQIDLYIRLIRKGDDR